MKHWKIILTFVAVFLAGAVAGGITAMRLAPLPFQQVPDPHKLADDLLRRLKSDLALRPDQETSIQPVLLRGTEQAVALHREFLHRMGENVDASDMEIEQHLDPAQKAKFEALRAKRPQFDKPPAS